MPATKLIIGNIPQSYSNDEIEGTLRDVDGTRSRREGGTHPLAYWQEIPSHRLPSQLHIGPCKATLYHYERKAARHQQSATCVRCLIPGHSASSCQSDTVCRECREPGHKRGNPACPLPAVPSADNATQDATTTTPTQQLIRRSRLTSQSTLFRGVKVVVRGGGDIRIVAELSCRSPIGCHFVTDCALRGESQGRIRGTVN